jgi:putative SOS response-associated peptidase YedK
MGLRTPPLPGFEEFTERPRFNIAPSQRMPIVRAGGERARELAAAHWGLIPSWTTEPKFKPINARAENVAAGGMFKQAFYRRRCLVPADGFYEWRGLKPPRQPFFIHRKDDRQFAFAGLWERWRAPGAEPLDTFTIITTTPNELMAGIYDRMPIILRPDDYARWLDASVPIDQIQSLLVPCPDDELEAYPVSARVNSPKNDDADCFTRAE